MSSFNDHPQYQFLKEAGMSEREISDYLCKEFGLRKRKEEQKEIHTKDHILSVSAYKPLRVTAKEI